jgi:hypothetical protein
MNGAVDIQKITRVVPLALSDTGNGADERGWLPMIALTDEVRPIVFELNVN